MEAAIKTALTSKVTTGQRYDSEKLEISSPFYEESQQYLQTALKKGRLKWYKYVGASKLKGSWTVGPRASQWYSEMRSVDAFWNHGHRVVPETSALLGMESSQAQFHISQVASLDRARLQKCEPMLENGDPVSCMKTSQTCDAKPNTVFYGFSSHQPWIKETEEEKRFDEPSMDVFYPN
ncbi:hypothetical protein P7K49_029887 [Saguinus oedipus]|uniref:Uncharacterized protein n=1 Tax=Saguinus oedipus TaxID=9490 RepID=A0ABQ9U8H2_SAGOE|nr:hypothetical protein P7K49_029887 [Saguinus oedipus]